MNIGLPGTGIGGLFYLGTALCMPLLEIFRTLRGKSNFLRWQRVIVLTSLALGILAGLWATGFLLDHLIAQQILVFSGKKNFLLAQQASRVLGTTPTVITLITLASVVLLVELLHLLSRAYSLARRLLRTG